jgi:hypothetical protein
MRRLLGTALLLSIANIASVSISVWAADASPASATGNLPPLLENIGHAEWVIDTRSGLAQQYFNQGVRLLYGFNFEQAIDAFRAANMHDGGGCAICCWGESYAVGKLSRVAEVTYIPCRWLIARGAVGRNLNAGMEQDRIPTANGTAYVPVVPQALRAPSQSGSAPFTNPSHALDCLPTRSGAPTSGAAAS